MAMTNPGLRAPRQARSRRTLSRILDEAERLIGEGSLQAASIPRIVEGAGTSIGAFYSRFDGRKAMLNALHDRFLVEARELVVQRLAADEIATLSMIDLLQRVVHCNVLLYRRHRGLLKAVYYHTRIEPSEDFLSRARAVNEEVFGHVAAALATRESELRHPNPSLGVALAFTAMASVLREAIVFGESKLFPCDLPDDELVVAVAHMLARQLGCEEAP